MSDKKERTPEISRPQCRADSLDYAPLLGADHVTVIGVEWIPVRNFEYPFLGKRKRKIIKE